MNRQLKPTKQAKPAWLKKRIPPESAYRNVDVMLNTKRIHTVCQMAKCPNMWECFSQKTATFLIMGPNCTRNCGFCAVASLPVSPPDVNEPERVAAAVENMRLNYVVITSVTRDDLVDGGAAFFSKTVEKIRQKNPGIFIELLIPDFRGNKTAIKIIVDAKPDVLNHNIETVERLYASVRPEASYHRSLDLLRQVKKYDPAIYTKSGIMLGLGESSEELITTLKDLLDTGCRMLTLGQYLPPTQKHLPVHRYVKPEEFDSWRETALQMGFAQVASGPFVRSSYQAENLFRST
jgi:lipoyl synthase